MAAYTEFARVYEELMDNVPYEAWCEYLTDILAEYDISDGLVLELGCGTGTMTRLFAKKGYDMIGVDASEDMLSVARERECEGILYLLQDMREFELYGTVRAVISVCDSMNYILEEEDLLTVFKLVNNYLDPGGIFVFDMNTMHKYRDVIGDSVIGENREDVSFIWENYFDGESCVNEYALTMFVQKENGLYEKQEEFHYQRAYEIDQVIDLLEKAGMEVLSVYAEGSRDLPDAESERVYFVAREHGK